LGNFSLSDLALTDGSIDPQHRHHGTSPEALWRSGWLHAGCPARRGVEVRMDALMTQLARELTDAVAAAVADDARVAACREKARAAGWELRLSLEAVIGFADRPGSTVVKKAPPRANFEMSANDRRFLKSLRIAADEPTEKEVE
jgi:hypothetical protein